MISKTASRRTLRTIALVEAAKGGLVLFVGCGLLTLLHRDVDMLLIELMDHLHLNPSKKFPSILIDAASRVTDAKLWFYAALALVYSAFRLTEGYGLWRERAWAEWIALVSGMVYLVPEIYGLTRKFTLFRVSVLSVNLLVVVLIAMVLWRTIATRQAHRDAMER